MSILLHDKVEKPTYYYSHPVKFMENTYSDSRSLVEAFLNHWDYAITTFKCGDWNDFWDTCVDTDSVTKEENKKRFEEIYNAMWEPPKNIELKLVIEPIPYYINVDILFAKVIHYLEPDLKEIPCFLDDTSVSLWNCERLRGFFKRELEKKDKMFLDVFFCLHLRDRTAFEMACEKRIYNFLYVGQMIIEKVFSLYGYGGAEDEVLALIDFDSIEERTRRVKNWISTYQGVADRLHQGKEFLYKDKICTSLEEFGILWKDQCGKWSIKEWDEFLESLFEEKEGVLGFRQWLLKLGEQELYDDLKEWRKETQKWTDLSEESERKESIRLTMKAKQPELKLPFGGINQEECNPIIKNYEEQLETYRAWVVENSKKSRMESLGNLYFRIYQRLEEETEDMPGYDSSALKAEFDVLIGIWKQWEEENQRFCEEAKMLVRALGNQDILSYWNHNFTNLPRLGKKAGTNRQNLALLACIPIEESYQKNCREFLQLIEAGGVGCTAKEVQGYAEVISCHIYGDLLKESMVSREKKDYTKIDEMVEYYFELLEKLSQKLPENVKLSDIIDGASIQIIASVNHRLSELNSEFRNNCKFNEKNQTSYQSQVKELPPERKDVGYSPFFVCNELYKNWQVKKVEIRKIEEEWMVQSKEVKRLMDEWLTYVLENCTKKSIGELYKDGEDKIKASSEILEAAKQKEQEWKQAVATANELCDIIERDRKQYEDDWDKRETEREAEEQREKELRRRAAEANERSGIAVKQNVGEWSQRKEEREAEARKKMEKAQKGSFLDKLKKLF